MKSLLSILFTCLAAASLGQVCFVEENTNKPIPGVMVLSNGGDHFISDDSGCISDLKIGQYTSSALGFLPATFDQKGDSQTIALRPTLFELDAAVVTGQNEQVVAREAVQRVRVLGRAQMEEIGAQTVRDVLLLDPNIRIQQDLILGTQITLLGLEGKQVKILIDSVPVIGRLDGNVDLDQLSLNNIERIEVIEGPMSVEYGTDALGGTINIITKGASATNQASVQAQAESTGRYATSGQVNSQIGKLNLSANAERIFFEGNQIGARGFDWKPKEQIGGRLTLGRTWEKSSLSGSLEAYNERLWADGVVNYFTEERPVNDSIVQLVDVPFALDQDLKTQRLNARLDGKKEFGETILAQGFVAANWFNRERLTSRVDLTDLTEVLTSDPADHDTTGFVSFSSRSKVVFRDMMDWTLGYDVSFEEALGKRILDESGTYTNLGVFTSATVKAGAWTLVPGLRYQYNSVYDAPLIPSLNARWQGEKFTARLAYGRGFRAPDLKELFFFFVDSNHNIQGNTSLNAETSESVQANLAWRNIRDKSVWEVQGGVYAHFIDDLIELALVDQDLQLYQYVNLDRQQVYGGQASMTWISGRSRLNAGGSYVLKYSWLNGAFDTPQAGSMQINGAYTYSIPDMNMTLNMTQTYYGEQPNFVLVDDEVSTSIQDAYSLTSVSVRKELFSNKIVVQAGVNNLFDVTTVQNSLVSSGTHSGGAGATPISLGRSVLGTITWNIR